MLAASPDDPAALVCADVRLGAPDDLDALPAHAKSVDVDAMRQEEAVALLGAGLPAGREAELRALAARMGEWPLLLTLAGGALRKKRRGEPLTAEDVAEAVAFCVTRPPHVDVDYVGIKPTAQATAKIVHRSE